MDAGRNRFGPKRRSRVDALRDWRIQEASPGGSASSRRAIPAKESDYRRLISCLAILEGGLEVLG